MKMICPECGIDNIVGEDYCGNCGSDLRDYDLPVFESGLAVRILSDTVESLKPPEPIILKPTDTVSKAVSLMREKAYGSVLIAEGDKLTGIFTERDLLRRAIEQEKELSEILLKEVMTTPPERIENSAPVAYALNKMSVEGIRHLPVTEGGKPIGFISARGMLKYVAGFGDI